MIETRPVALIIILIGEDQRWAADAHASGCVTAAWRIYCGKLVQHDRKCLAWATAALVWDCQERRVEKRIVLTFPPDPTADHPTDRPALRPTDQRPDRPAD